MPDTTAPDRTLANFKRSVDALAGVYYRMDKGLLTGRNSDATAQTLDAHMATARALLKSVLNDTDHELWAYLDSHPRFAAKWDRLERRYYGVRV